MGFIAGYRAIGRAGIDNSRVLDRAIIDERQAAGPPVVVIGMHRSGMTMLVRMLQATGAWMGLRDYGSVPVPSEAGRLECCVLMPGPKQK